MASPLVIPSVIDFGQRTLWISAASIIFNPTFWNLVARNEYRNHSLTRLTGSPYTGCYILASTIFTLGLIRDYLYTTALSHQPISQLLTSSPLTAPLAWILFLSGNTLVLSSMYALGITGTYLGDYFGILMGAPVEGFPFNITGAPMYWGSCMSFAGTALWYGKPAGLVLTALVYVAYRVAIGFEDPFTEYIYKKRDQERKDAGKKVK